MEKHSFKLRLLIKAIYKKMWLKAIDDERGILEKIARKAIFSASSRPALTIKDMNLILMFLFFFK